MGGSEADTAVADHQRRHAVDGRRGEIGIPGELAVVVGMDVDPPRGHDVARGVDGAVRWPEVGTNGDDGVAVDCDVSRESRSPGTVHHSSIGDDEIMHCHSVSLPPVSLPLAINVSGTFETRIDNRLPGGSDEQGSHRQTPCRLQLG